MYDRLEVADTQAGVQDSSGTLNGAMEAGKAMPAQQAEHALHL